MKSAYQIGWEAAEASMDAHGYCVPETVAWEFMIGVYDDTEPDTADRMRALSGIPTRFVDGYGDRGSALLLEKASICATQS